MIELIGLVCVASVSLWFLYLGYLAFNTASQLWQRHHMRLRARLAQAQARAQLHGARAGLHMLAQAIAARFELQLATHDALPAQLSSSDGALYVELAEVQAAPHRRLLTVRIRQPLAHPLLAPVKTRHARKPDEQLVWEQRVHAPLLAHLRAREVEPARLLHVNLEAARQARHLGWDAQLMLNAVDDAARVNATIDALRSRAQALAQQLDALHDDDARAALDDETLLTLLFLARNHTCLPVAEARALIARHEARVAPWMASRDLFGLWKSLPLSMLLRCRRAPDAPLSAALLQCALTRASAQTLLDDPALSLREDDVPALAAACLAHQRERDMILARLYAMPLAPLLNALSWMAPEPASKLWALDALRDRVAKRLWELEAQRAKLARALQEQPSAQAAQALAWLAADRPGRQVVAQAHLLAWERAPALGQAWPLALCRSLLLVPGVEVAQAQLGALLTRTPSRSLCETIDALREVHPIEQLLELALQQPALRDQLLYHTDPLWRWERVTQAWRAREAPLDGETLTRWHLMLGLDGAPEVHDAQASPTEAQRAHARLKREQVMARALKAALHAMRARLREAPPSPQLYATLRELVTLSPHHRAAIAPLLATLEQAASSGALSLAAQHGAAGALSLDTTASGALSLEESSG